MKLSEKELAVVVADYVKANKLSSDSFTETRDNTVGLLDKIGKIVYLETNYLSDKLNWMDGEALEYGKTIEEWADDLILPVDYDPTGANALAPADPTYRPVFYSYTLGRKKVKTTIRNNDFERAVNNEAQMIAIATRKAMQIQNSVSVFRYGMKREILAKVIGMVATAYGTTTTFAHGTDYNEGVVVRSASSGDSIKYGIVVKKYDASEESVSNWADAVAQGFIIEYDMMVEIAKPVDTSTGEAFIKQVKNDVEIAKDINEGHSFNGNTLGATSGLKLVVVQGVMASLDVDTFAGAFHQDKVAIPCEVEVIKDFGSDTSGAFAILMDSRGARLFNTYKALRDDKNGDGDFTNLTHHTEDTASISRNCFFKIYKPQA